MSMGVAIPSSISAVIVFLICLLLAGTFLRAQVRRRADVGLVPPMQNDGPSAIELNDKNAVVDANGKTISTDEYACFLPPLNSVSPGTVGLVDLQVPWKPRSEYQSGCDALHRFADGERHLRKAIGQYDKYAAAWVLLGQVLELQHTDMARQGSVNLEAKVKEHGFNTSYMESPGAHYWFIWRIFLGDFGSKLFR